MNQRLLMLASTSPKRVRGVYIAVVTAPPSSVAAPPGYYTLFVVNNGIPSVAKWRVPNLPAHEEGPLNPATGKAFSLLPVKISCI